jgi:tyrosine-protein kinase
LTPSGSRDAITPQRVARILWRRRLVCLLVAAVVVAVGGGLLLSRPKVYQSTSSVALLPVSTNSGVLPNYPNLIASLIPTYVQLVSSPVLLDRVAATLPFHVSEAELADDVHAESLSSAAVIDIVAENPDPVRAQQIAARATAEFLVQLRGNGVVIPRIYGQPVVPGKPVGAGAKLALAVVLALAVILGIAAALVWDRLSGPAPGISREPRADRPGGPPVLGVVTAGQRDAAPVTGAPHVAAHDGIQALRTNFMYATADRHTHSVMISSLGPGEGATTVAVNLALSVAELGLAVVLVDANLRHPAIHEVLGLDNTLGLTSAARGGAEPASLLRSVPAAAGVQVVTAGPPLKAPQDELGLYLQQLPKFTALADLVIVDGPALRSGGHAHLVANATDGVVLVMRSGVRRAGPVAAAQRILRGAPVLGAVLTRTSRTANGDKPGPDAGNVRIISSGSAE